MAELKFIPKAIEIVKEAVKADQNKELEQALCLYKKALDHFVTGLKYEKNPRTKKAISEKVLEYMKRAEEIQKHLETPEPAPVKASSAGGGGGGGDGKEDKDKTAMQGSLSGAIVVEKPNIKWDDVAGLEGAKGLLKEAVILPIKFPQLFTGKRHPWRGILLYGPPGTGKSYLAKAVATEANNSTFFAVSSSDLVSKYQGESERLVKTLFEMAREQSPSIVFIDEIDSLCGNRSDGENDSTRRIKTEFLVQMQGVGAQNNNLLVLGATNTPWDLDPAVRRRFEKRIYIPLPEAHARSVMFRIHIGKTPNDLTEPDFASLGEYTPGFSGSDISGIVRDALMEPIRNANYFKKVPDPNDPSCPIYEQCFESTPGAIKMSLMDIPGGKLKPRDVCMDDFVKVIRTAKPSVGPDDCQRQVDWTEQFGMEGS